MVSLYQLIYNDNSTTVLGMLLENCAFARAEKDP